MKKVEGVKLIQIRKSDHRVLSARIAIIHSRAYGMAEAVHEAIAAAGWKAPKVAKERAEA